MTASLGNNGAEPNLTPILDMVFQLITFFMLVINFQGAALDLTLQLPVLGSARPLDTQGQEDLLVLNIGDDGRLKVYGVEKDIESYIAEEARVAVQKLRQEGQEIAPGDELPTTVVIRADRSTPFNLLNHVITTCQSHGFRKFALKAMNRAAEAAP
jgi:biopolymer transport protein ExbD